MAGKMSEDTDPEEFQKFEGKSGGNRRNRGGIFVTIHKNSPDSKHRRVYISADAMDLLDWPTYVEYWLDHANRRLAIKPTSKGSDAAYKIVEGNQYAAAELPLRELGVENLGTGRRLEAHYISDPGWLVVDFLGGATDA